VAGPSLVESLRGRLLGRDVALVLCGESHEEAIDLTRARCVTEPVEGWMTCEYGTGFNPADQLASQGGLSLERAKEWAERILRSAASDSGSEEEEEEEEDEDESDDDSDAGGHGGFLVFDGPSSSCACAKRSKAECRGTAHVFPAGAARSTKFPLPPQAVVLEFGDLDHEARDFNMRRLRGEWVPTGEHDALIDRRKRRLAEEDGVELLDDWLLRQAGFDGVHVSVVLETPVHPEELELHVDAAVGPAPPAHESLRRIELDSDADSDDDADPDDGSGCFMDYFHRRLAAGLPRQRVRGVDPRDIGDPGEDSLREAYQVLAAGHPAAPADVEIQELERIGAEFATHDEEEGEAWKERRSERLPPLPSWEGFFSAAAELLYYAPQVKGDWAPFLGRCIRDPPRLWEFFYALYFRTIPEAVAVLSLTPETRPLAQVRSLAYRPPGENAKLFRRPAVRSKIPVRTAPLDRYLKARGSDPPRTWTSALAARLREGGCADLVADAERWIRESVTCLLVDPKEADTEGDYFAAWLRACHRDIWDDIDRSDPQEIRRREWMPSVSHPKSKKHRHRLKDITIPGLDEAFRELAAFDPASRVSTYRERVLAKIIVDAFQVRLVDLAMIFAVAEAVLDAPPSLPVVVVLYAGEDHTKSVAEFWRAHGLSSEGLPKGGRVGKSDWEDDEPRSLTFPPYLQDVRRMFPLTK